MLSKVFGVASAILLAASTSATAASTMLTSWYGPGFHGRLTANGEVYDQMGLTAAHKTLPFGTRLRVCYQGCVKFFLKPIRKMFDVVYISELIFMSVILHSFFSFRLITLN